MMKKKHNNNRNLEPTLTEKKSLQGHIFCSWFPHSTVLNSIIPRQVHPVIRITRVTVDHNVHAAR